jgi:hypothetical protein
LLASTNGSDAVKSDLPYILYKDQKLIAKGDWRKYIDCENGVLPFLSFTTNADGMEAERNLDIFTQKVLIPLCVKTNAIVICTPTRACSLGMSFGKAANFLASKYGYRAFSCFSSGFWSVLLIRCSICSGKLPFTVLAIDSASNYVEVCDPLLLVELCSLYFLAL